VLSIGKLTGPDSDRYYTRSVASGREDYYTGRGEAPGYWAGSSTDLLMESDAPVSDDAFAALLSGHSPADGAPLRAATTAHGVSGYDLTFSAPKSVSVLYGVGGDEVSRQVRGSARRGGR
jgi:conjugative relaxase-like TrwC/TraI family protein